MKSLLKKQIWIYIAILFGGIGLGWLFFGSNHNDVASTHSQEDVKDQVYTCSMHPQIRSNEPGNCPLCGMELIPVGTSNEENGSPMAVYMSETAMELANVKTQKVSAGAPEKNLQLTGKIEVDERKVRTQSIHFPGRIEELFVNFTGEEIFKGQLLANVYSPELVTAQEEFMEAIQIKEENPEIYEAAKKKLLNWKLSVQEIQKLEQSKNIKETFPIYADVGGYVLEKNIQLGDYVQKGSSMFLVADLSTVWVMFDVFEKDLEWVHQEDKISFTVSSIPDKQFGGKISYIDPVFDPNTRAAKARVEFKNPSGVLKPKQFVAGILETKISNDKTNNLVVPKSAVMWTGKRSVVYVQISDKQKGHFKMREVTLGPSLGDFYIIEKGISEGDIIAVSGAFNIDAAAQLEGKSSMMNPEGGPAMTGHNHGQQKMDSKEVNHQHKMNSGKSFRSNSTKEFAEQLGTLVSNYMNIKNALIDGDVELTKTASNHFESFLAEIDMTQLDKNTHKNWMKHQSKFKEISNEIIKTSSMENARISFSKLSNQLIDVLKEFNPKFKTEQAIFIQHCPMALDSGAYWLSFNEQIENPYFGQKMLKCGSSTRFKF